MVKKMDLQRYVSAHQHDYDAALKEIRNGRKETHWMWYIFPQIRGLGRSSTSQYYAIDSLEEAAAFLSDPYLGGHLYEICEALLQLETNRAREVFGRPDDLKLRSSMTLFVCVAGPDSVFSKVLDKFFCGRQDVRTRRILSIE